MDIGGTDCRKDRRVSLVNSGDIVSMGQELRLEIAEPNIHEGCLLERLEEDGLANFEWQTEEVRRFGVVLFFGGYKGKRLEILM